MLFWMQKFMPLLRANVLEGWETKIKLGSARQNWRKIRGKEGRLNFSFKNSNFSDFRGSRDLFS